MGIDYRIPGVFTRLDGVPDEWLGTTGGRPAEICAAVPTLFVQPSRATEEGWDADRFDTNQLRAAADLVAALWARSPTPLSTPRDPESRVVGTCRHFTVLSVALLRRAGIPARARCGFGLYFRPGQALDHWVVEFLDGDRWVRMDTEWLGNDRVVHPEDLPVGAFQTGAEAWTAFRRHEADGATYGVEGTSNFGPSEIRGNVVRDLAALVRVEALPWDEWGRMTEAYDGRTGEDYDLLLDEVADAVIALDSRRIRKLATHPDLAPPLAAWGIAAD